MDMGMMRLSMAVEDRGVGEVVSDSKMLES